MSRLGGVEWWASTTRRQPYGASATEDFTFGGRALGAKDQSVQTLGLLCGQSFFRAWRREAQATCSIAPEVPPKRQEVA